METVYCSITYRGKGVTFSCPHIEGGLMPKEKIKEWIDKTVKENKKKYSVLRKRKPVVYGFFSDKRNRILMDGYN